MDNDKNAKVTRLPSAPRRSTASKVGGSQAHAKSNDSGRLATPDEANKAWSEVIPLIKKLSTWNLPKAAEYLRGHRPSEEAIALGLFAIVEMQRRESQMYGQRGKKSGFKGGRPSAKPTRVDLHTMYERHRKDADNCRQARATLVKELQKSKGVSATTVRGWLRDATI